MDTIERALQDISKTLTDAWRGSQCQTCPLAELAALAQATLVFYQQEQQKKAQPQEHWSDSWRREWKRG